MVRRLISANSSEILSYTAEELKQSIKASDGRTILSENVCVRDSFVGDITSSEIAAAYGADLLLLNGIDLFNPYVAGLDKEDKNNFVEKLHELTGRPIGANLEPIDLNVNMNEERLLISEGRQATINTFKKAKELKLDFICITGNPGVGVSNKGIAEAIKLAKTHFNGLVIGGKMHSAGADEPVINTEIVKDLIDAGVDILMIPAVGTVPGVRDEMVYEAVDYAHKNNVLVMSAIGTSQEGSDISTIRQIAFKAKAAGVDIQHIGDAGFGGLAPVQNIYETSIVVRGIRHTASRISRSINR
ncbi:DUF7916 family protein [Globicatella sanguinis]|uniref:DUF7916 family protein n=1 Tax=Globicatella sanguinis TaxID=13076 RepID=UPI0025430902|nr:haloacid dehalogenase-like hydrolase [Globicatella sanguinis]MDK7629795.1 haloacid dehalogenase-like hydrolase [Globicatella sanguinis]WIK67280.1 haloacid dehalogenase-like hydrolase [Globicatella sanguinis]WKT56685.1 haloacid dehalogenase-like hydrolase [Globicatella sanguinis]